VLPCSVAVHYLEDETTPTGTCAVLITDKDRSGFPSLPGACAAGCSPARLLARQVACCQPCGCQLLQEGPL